MKALVTTITPSEGTAFADIDTHEWFYDAHEGWYGCKLRTPVESNAVLMNAFVISESGASGFAQYHAGSLLQPYEVEMIFRRGLSETV